MKRSTKYPNTSTFCWHNANPKGRITGDCTYRAISTACGFSYEKVVRDMAELQCRTGYASRDLIDLIMQEYGWSKMRQPRKSDNTKYTGNEFCKVQQKKISKDGIVIADRIFCSIGGHHVVAIVDGKVYDIWDSTNGCIGNYWVKMK